MKTLKNSTSGGRETRHLDTFIDVFAGCGGLSLGLMKAGWNGLFAVERDRYAFSTLTHNLRHSVHDGLGFDWPNWLPDKPAPLEGILKNNASELTALKGSIKLLVGGPPCQGFSMLGKRQASDPRNQAFRSYIRLVEILEPRIVLIENVRGIASAFEAADHPLCYSDMIIKALEGHGYKVWSEIVTAADYGVPQLRPRFIIVGLRTKTKKEQLPDPFGILKNLRAGFLNNRRLPSRVPVADALSDLTTKGKQLVNCSDSPRFLQGQYGDSQSSYQHLMHGIMGEGPADSHRFAHHRPDTVKKFKWFLEHCAKGRKLEQHERGPYRNRKHTVYILDEKKPAPTITTLPDDILHYAEPRILSVREMARLQSFPDWFQFKGKYTTGGIQRTKECPRYTQVGNAVPPLLAEALGHALLHLSQSVCNQNGAIKRTAERSV